MPVRALGKQLVWLRRVSCIAGLEGRHRACCAAGVAMEDPAGAAEAVKVALNWSATPEARQAATAFLDAIKAGDVHVLGAVAFAISKEGQPLEVRHFGLKLLQHLIRIRWDELNSQERQKMASMVLDMVRQFAKPYEQWSLKSQTAALAAEVARREGPALWKEMLQTLFIVSDISPVHAEMVAMVLRWLPEDVIVHNEDLEGGRRRMLLSGLTQSLPESLPFMYKLLDKHFGEAMGAVQRQELELAKQHAAVVTAGLNALLAYADWAPITTFATYGLIEACGFLLNSMEFRLSSCEILKQLVTRRRPADETANIFNSAVARVFEIISGVSEAYFQHLHAGGGINESVDFAECLCEALVAIGLQNLQAIACEGHMLMLYYKQMLAFFQHPKFALHVQALPLWLTLVRDSLTPGGDQGKPILASPDKEKKSSSRVVPEEIGAVLLDVAFQKLLKKTYEKDFNEEAENAEDEFSSASDFSQYRGRLIELIRLIASLHPKLAITKVLQRLEVALKTSVGGKVSSQELLSLESTHIMLDAVVSGIVVSPTFGQTNELRNIMEGLLQRLLSVEWSEPELVEVHGKYFDALGPYLKHVQPAVPLVIQKLFKILTSVPVALKEANTTSGRVRLQVCTSFLRIAKAAGSALLPHMQSIAQTMIELQHKGLLLRGEHILLGEALLVAASAAGTEQQAQVLEWLLGPFRERWVELEWQQKYLSDLGGLVRLMSEEMNDVAERLCADKGMWYIYHSVALFEKALRRCGSPTKVIDGSDAPIDPSSRSSFHPMAAHMFWILPPLVQLLRCIHSLWSPPVLSTLPATIQKALAMGVSEQASILGEGIARPVDGREDELRNWLKGIRDSGYNVLGIASSRLGDEFFNNMTGMAGTLAAGLLENLSSMEFRHLRLLIHLVVTPFVKACPRYQWGAWFGTLLPPILVHCHVRLPVAWESLMKEGAAKTSTLFAASGASGLKSASGATGLKSEVIEERILRDLTREVCNLLAVLASPELNQTSSEEQGMLFFIMHYSDAAFAALRLGIQSLQWPDTDAVHKGVVFCGAVINMAVTLNDAQLREIVGKDMFTTVIQSLTLESNAAAQAELLGLLREILVRLAVYTPAPKQVLMALPLVTQQEFATFESSFAKTSSAKEQRQLIKSLLLAAGGDHLKALKPQKNTNVITNITSLPQEKAKQNIEDSEFIGLATIL